jgi:hypothetical protein
MAVARPIRMLGAVGILLCLFLVFHLNQTPSAFGGKLINGMKRDPLLDRTCFLATPTFFFFFCDRPLQRNNTNKQ